MIPYPPDLEATLGKARASERKYHWSEAADSYEATLASSDPIILSHTSEIHEHLGYALFRSSMQAKDAQEFQCRMQQAARSYRKARNTYLSQEGGEKGPRVLRCEAMISQIEYWLAPTIRKKKKLIDECWKLTKMSLKAFNKGRELWEFGKTFNQLSLSAFLAFFLEWNFQTRKTIIKEAADYGERAVDIFSRFRDSHELVLAQVKTAVFFEMFGLYFHDLDERESWMQKASSYRLRAKEQSEETAITETLNSGAGVILPLLDEELRSSKETINDFQKALKYSKKTKDKFIKGWTFAWMAFHEGMVKTAAEYHAKEAIEANKRGFKYAERARKNFSSISFTCPLWGGYWTESPRAEYYYGWAEHEANLQKVLELLDMARRSAFDQLERAESSGYPEAICYAQLMFAAILKFRAKVEADSEKKKRFLEEALSHQSECVRVFSEFFPFSFMMHIYTQKELSSIEWELSKVSKDVETKRRFLKSATTHQGKMVALGIKHLNFWEGQGVHSALLRGLVGSWQYFQSVYLSQLYECTGNVAYLRKAAETLNDAAERFQRRNIPSYSAECNWRRALIHETLGEYANAAKCFGLASDNYYSAGRSIPQFKDFYRGLAVYMDVWEEVERAKHRHQRQEYGPARQHFDSAARMVQKLKQGGYLSPNFSAWAQLEHAEELSRAEQIEDAIKSFDAAAGLFEETQRSLRTSSDKIKSVQTNDVAIGFLSFMGTNEREGEIKASLVKATDARRGYCLARISIEEARIFDQKGDHYSSSEKYALAAEIFKKIGSSLDSEEDVREFNFFATVSRAWQKMMLAEANVSPELFAEASQFFENASHLCNGEEVRLSILGHSHFCKALEVGTRFTDARELGEHSVAMQHLQTATNYYKRARLENAAEYARATGQLFDSYVYMDGAKKEIDPQKKSRLYRMTEMLLQASAGSYLKAKRPEKREQVMRLLEAVKEDGELAVSLSEVLRTPPIISAPTFTPPIPTQEKPVGLERLEHAVVRAHMQASPQVTVGEEFEVRLDLVNVAKNLGVLVRIDDLVPQGFKATGLPPQFKLEDGSLDTNGKRLEPLKVETVKISMEAFKTGVFSISPKAVYMDDTGMFQTSSLEAVQVTVQPPLSFSFKTETAKIAFNYLTHTFIEDYMKRQIFVQEAGWRSLIQIVKDTGIPFRSVYGTRGRHGSAISELQTRGLITTRIFQGRRGRGGTVLRVRVFYEKETIKRYIDDRVANGVKNQGAVLGR